MIETYTCPFLGIETDNKTRSACPGIPNFCHKVAPPRPVREEYQHAVCAGTMQNAPSFDKTARQNLTYQACPFFAPLNHATHAQLEEAFLHTRKHRSYQVSFSLVMSILIVCLMVLLGYFWMIGDGAGTMITIFAQAPSPTTYTPPTVQSRPATATPVEARVTIITFEPPSSVQPVEIAFSETLTVTPLSTSTATPVFTLIPEQLPVTPTASTPRVGTPTRSIQFTPTSTTGVNVPKLIFVIHKVASGETLSSIARDNRTTVEVICAVNGRKAGDTVIVTGNTLIILPDKYNLEGVIALRPFYIAVSAKVDDIAAQFGVSANQIRVLNGVSGEKISGPKWIVVELK
jgi:LysM repeat protein